MLFYKKEHACNIDMASAQITYRISPRQVWFYLHNKVQGDGGSDKNRLLKVVFIYGR